jgi:hypothetical protein
MRMFKIFIIITLFAINVKSQTFPLPGSYEGNMFLALDNQAQKFIGYYENQTGEGKFCCAFLFEGILSSAKDNSCKIISFLPNIGDTIKGTMKFIDKNSFSIKLDDDQPGCWNVQSFKDDLVQFSLFQECKWIDIKIIKEPKAYFYSEPDNSKKKKAYLIKGDCIKVLEKNSSWLKVEFSAKKTTIGWIRLEDCY